MVWAHQGLPSMAWAMAYSKESIPTLGSKCAFPQQFKHLAHGSLSPHGSKQVCNQTQLWTILHMTSWDTTRRPVVGQGPQRSVGRPTNWVMPPGPTSHRPRDLLEGQWDPLSSKWQVGRPTFTPTYVPMMNTWWKSPTVDHMAVPRSVYPMVHVGGHADRWRGAGVAPTPSLPYKYPLREPS